MVLRRELLRTGASVPLVLALNSGASAANVPAPPTPFNADTVRGLAKQLASQPFKPPDTTLPSALEKLSYSQYRSIRFNPDHALWGGQGLNFNVQLFHRGFLYKDRVDLFQVVNGQAQPIQYNPTLFIFGKLQPPSGDIGYAGFRLHFPLNRLDYFDEVCAFLGASYFRALARGQGYGLSARGLAINTAESSGEEFPVFRTFWLEQPAKGANAMTVHALLDSKSCAGAFRFVIAPGQDTIFDTQCAIYPRVDMPTVGLAPLTSMFFFGANDHANADDWRAAVHDSGGLALHTGQDQRIWRPLINPHALQISSFSDVGPRGFGLMQSPREFVYYQDLEAHYEKRPSLWIEPQGNWGPGVVELVEIPSNKEVNDNIVAFWRPHDPLKAKSENKLAYRMHWCWTDPHPGPVAHVVQTRAGLAWNGTDRQFVIDFAGAPLDAWTKPAAPALDVGTDKGKIVSAVAERNPNIHGWRVSIQLATNNEKVVELHARMMDGEQPLTETWIARWTAS
ncbi:MAG TPA: glucan biosynthesis protein G [Acetobacteraceae bacterium]